jgi:hypothetical protein
LYSSTACGCRQLLAAVVDHFKEAGYDASAPGWPGDAETVQATRANAEAVANHGVDEITDHYAKVISVLPAKPIVIAHSSGGVIVEKLLGEGHATAAVAIDAHRSRGSFRSRSRHCGPPSSRFTTPATSTPPCR